MLYKIPYKVFRGAIKRNGYLKDLSDTHMKDIANEIGCDYDEMIDNQRSAFSIVYNSSEFKTGEKQNKHEYSVKALLKLGWLQCIHESRDS